MPNEVPSHRTVAQPPIPANERVITHENGEQIVQYPQAPGLVHCAEDAPPSPAEVTAVKVEAAEGEDPLGIPRLPLRGGSAHED